MHRMIVALAALLTLTAVPALAADERPTVTLDSGAVVGVREGRIAAFKGIPYAAPPVGSLRWAPPAPVAPWSAPRDAAKFGAICPQQGGRPRGEIAQAQSEDCLFLNVWTFKGAAHAPVMVWIHGGAFRFGASSQAIYDGSDFARDGVILVSINYRLGALGFFAHPALTKAAAPDAPLGNYGIMDQIAALQWVKRNIAAFGGDPDRVTVAGESAGGVSVLDLLGAPAARGLFAQAIVESGGGWSAGTTLAQAEAKGVELATAAGVGADATPDQLRAIPVEKLFAIPMTLAGVNPFIDGRLIRESTPRAFAAGHEAPVPLLIGSNDYEAALMLAFKIPASAVLANTPPAIRALYPANDDTAAADIFTDSAFGAPARWLAGEASAHAPAFLYNFTYVATLQRAQLPGAPHGGEIPFVFGAWTGLIDQYASPQDRAMEKIAHACWVGFVKRGQPSCGAAWPAYSPSADVLMHFGDESGPVRDPFKARYDALEQLSLPRLVSPP